MKAIKKYCSSNFGKVDIDNKSGSARRIELFEKEEDEQPCNFWVVHESEYVYSDDLKKTYEGLGIDKEEFIQLTNKRKNK